MGLNDFLNADVGGVSVVAADMSDDDVVQVARSLKCGMSPCEGGCFSAPPRAPPKGPMCGRPCIVALVSVTGGLIVLTASTYFGQMCLRAWQRAPGERDVPSPSRVQSAASLRYGKQMLRAEVVHSAVPVHVDNRIIVSEEVANYLVFMPAEQYTELNRDE